LNGPADRYVNITLNYNRLNIIHETNPGETYRLRLAAVVSASSDADVHVYGVKSDKGTGDGFLALPLTHQSKQFFVASWKSVNIITFVASSGRSVADWLACWTQAQKGPRSNRSRDAVG